MTKATPISPCAASNPDYPIGNRGALGFYRDLDGRLSALLIGPLPDDMYQRLAADLTPSPRVGAARSRA